MPQTLILVTILLITQVTELKLLFETQVTKHRFYYVILTSLITCIIIEIIIGLVTVYMTQKRMSILSKVPLVKDRVPPPATDAPNPPPSNPGRYTQFYNDDSAKQYHIFKPTQLSTSNISTSQSTTFIASTSQLRHNLPFADSSSESISSTNHKLPTIPEISTAADNSLFTIARFHDEEEATVKGEVDEATSISATNNHNKCCFGCYEGKSLQNTDRHLLKMWQNFHFYLLYIVMVLNVFITAFGLSGENIKLKN